MSLYQYQIWDGLFYPVQILLKTQEFFYIFPFPDFWSHFVSAGTDLFKFSNINTRAMCEICSNMFKYILVSLLLIKTPEWRHSFDFVNFEQISYIVLMFLMTEQKNTSWAIYQTCLASRAKCNTCMELGWDIKHA